MQLKIFMFAILFSFFAVPVMAGSNHSHDPDPGHGHSHEQIDQTTATNYGKSIIAELIKRDKLDESWTSSNTSSVERKVFEGHHEWEVVFVNKKVTETGKQKLYIFLTLEGEYVAANFTGQ